MRTRASFIFSVVLSVAVSSLSLLGVGALTGPAAAATPLGLQPGDLVIADTGANRLVVHPADGGSDRVITAGLFSPQGVLVTEGGDIVVADQGNNRIVRIPADGSAPVQLNFNNTWSVEKLAFDGQGNVLFGGPAWGGIGRVSLFGGSATNYIPGTNYTGIAVTSDRDIVAATAGDDHVNRMRPNGSSPTLLPEVSNVSGAAGDCFTPRPCNIGDVALTSDDRAVVADTWNNLIWESNGAGGATTYGTGLAGPSALAVDRFGGVYAADTGNDRVVRFAPGTHAQSDVVTGLSSPGGVAVVPLPPAQLGDTFVTTSQGELIRMDANGTNPVTLATGLGTPTDVAVDSSGNAYVSTVSGRIYRVPAAGAPLAQVVDVGSPVEGLAVGPDDALYFTAPGDGIDRWTAADGVSTAVASAAALTAVALDGAGRIYVADAMTLYRVSGGALEPLRSGFGDLGALTWDPAGGLVLVDTTGAVYTIGLDGTGLAPLAGAVSATDVTIDATGAVLVTRHVLNQVVSYPGGTTFATVLLVNAVDTFAHAPILDGTGGLPTTANVGTAYAGFTFSATENSGGTVTYGVYSGSLPPGLTLDPATGDLAGTPTTAGDYTFRVVAANQARGAVFDPVTIAVGKRLQSITFTSTPVPPVRIGDATYLPAATGGGSGSPVTFSIDPGSSTVCSYDSGTGAVTMLASGTCRILADQAGDGSYEPAPTAHQDVFVDKLLQTATMTSTAPTNAVVGGTYTPTGTGGPSGNPISFRADPFPFPVPCSVDGSGVVHFDHVGTCQVRAVIAGDDHYWEGLSPRQTISVAPGVLTFAEDAPATAAIGSRYLPTTNYPSFPWIDVDASSDPGACSMDYGTGEVVFDGVGTCVIFIDTFGDTDYSPTTMTRSITVTKAPQTITFTTLAPASAPIGSTYTPAATGGGSGNPVTFSIAPGSSGTCSLVAGVVHLDHPGSCVVRADQAGDATYADATTATQTIAVARDPSSVTITSDPGHAVVGQQYAVTATSSPSGGAVSVGAGPASVCHATGSVVSLDHAGDCQVQVTWPGDATHDSSTATQTVTVSPAATTLTAVLGSSSLTATLAVVEPGAGIPTGVVEFSEDGTSLGSAELTRAADGRLVAVLDEGRPIGGRHQVVARYVGSSDFAASQAEIAWVDPQIAATLTSRKPKLHGWYRTPVTVRFVCSPGSAALETDCPAPVVLNDDDDGSATLLREVTATDGGYAKVLVTGVRIDRTAPRVTVRGVRPGHTYGAKRPVRCVAADALSGVDRCQVRQSVRAHGVVVYRATAWDLAGNKTVVRGRYHLR